MTIEATTTAPIREPRMPMNAADPIDIEMGARLRALREARGIKMRGLATLLDVSHVTMQRMEQGIIALRPHRMVQVCKALQVDPAWFFKGLLAKGHKAIETDASSFITTDGCMLMRRLSFCTAPQRERIEAALMDMLFVNEAEEMDPDRREKIRLARFSKRTAT